MPKLDLQIGLREQTQTFDTLLPSALLDWLSADDALVIDADGTGLFQPHGMPAIPISIWIDVDDKGEPRRQIGTEQRYRYTLLIQYGAGGGGNYPAVRTISWALRC